MNAANPELPELPQDLENRLYATLMTTVGYDLAMPAVDAVTRAIYRAGYTVVPVRAMVKGRNDA